VVAVGGIEVQGVASFSGGVLSHGRGVPKRTGFGGGEVVGFGVVLGLFSSEITDFGGVFRIGADEGSNVGVASFRGRSCVTDDESIVTC
jgi:hypothetical protein